jgi:hypothetical protein
MGHIRHVAKWHVTVVPFKNSKFRSGLAGENEKIWLKWSLKTEKRGRIIINKAFGFGGCPCITLERGTALIRLRQRYWYS